jgi:hypothetical protein
MFINYKKILAYAGIEALLYQLLLIAHQSMLYTWIDKQTYGLIGTVFSLIYLGVSITHAGFDQAVARHFQRACTDRTYYKHLIFDQAWYNLLFILPALVVLQYIFKAYYQPLLSVSNLVLIMLCILIELYKKSTKNILYLMLHHRFVLVSELFHIISYISSVWLLLYNGAQPSLAIALIPLLIASSIQTIVHGAIIIRSYYQLPTTTASCRIDWLALINERCAHYVYQLTHTFYSANLLVPVLAYTHGMEFAGMLKFASMIAYSINSIIRHTFGSACTGIFSALQRASLADKQHAFAWINSYLLTAGCTIFSLLCILSCIAYATNIYTWNSSITIGVFLFLIFSEHIIITHEQFMLLEGKAWPLCFVTGIALAPLLFLYTAYTPSAWQLLLGLIVAKYLSYGLTVYYTQNFWQLTAFGVRSNKEAA